MLQNQLWQPDDQTQSSIRRGNKLFKEYLDSKSREYAALRAARLLRQNPVHQEKPTLVLTSSLMSR